MKKVAAMKAPPPRRSVLRKAPETVKPENEKPSTHGNIFSCFLGETQSLKKSDLQTNLLGNNCFCLKSNCPGIVHVVEMDRVLTAPCSDFPLYSIETRRLVKCNKCFYVSSLNAHRLNSVGTGKIPVVKLDRAHQEVGRNMHAGLNNNTGDHSDSVKDSNNARKSLYQHANTNKGLRSPLNKTKKQGKDTSTAMATRHLVASEAEPNHHSRHHDHHHTRHEQDPFDQSTLTAESNSLYSSTFGDNHLRQTSSSSSSSNSKHVNRNGKQNNNNINNNRDGIQRKKEKKEQQHHQQRAVTTTTFTYKRKEGAPFEEEIPNVKSGDSQENIMARLLQKIKSIGDGEDRLQTTDKTYPISPIATRSSPRPHLLTSATKIQPRNNTAALHSKEKIESKRHTPSPTRKLEVNALASNTKSKSAMKAAEKESRPSPPIVDDENDADGYRGTRKQGEDVHRLDHPQLLQNDSVKRPPEWLVCGTDGEEVSGLHSDGRDYKEYIFSREQELQRLKKDWDLPARRRKKNNDTVCSPDPPNSPHTRKHKQKLKEDRDPSPHRRNRSPHRKNTIDTVSSRDPSISPSPSPRKQVDPPNSEEIQRQTRYEISSRIYSEDTSPASDLIRYIAQASRGQSSTMTPHHSDRYRDHDYFHAPMESLKEDEEWSNNYAPMEYPYSKDPPQEPGGTKAKYKDPRGRRRRGTPSLSSNLTNPNRKKKHSERNDTWRSPNHQRLWREDAPAHYFAVPKLPKTPPFVGEDANDDSSDSPQVLRMRRTTESPGLAYEMSPDRYGPDATSDDRSSPAISSRNDQKQHGDAAHNHHRHHQKTGHDARQQHTSKNRRHQRYVEEYYRSSKEKYYQDRDRHNHGRITVPTKIQVKSDRPPAMSLPAVDGPSMSLAMADLSRIDERDRALDDVIKESITVLRQTIPRRATAIAPVMPELS